MKIKNVLRATIWVVGLLACNVAAYAESPQFKVTPSVLKPGFTAQLSLPSKHPKGFAIEDPTGKWIYLVDESRYSLVGEPINSGEFEGFAKKTTFSFAVSDLEGITEIDGKKQKVRVFTKNGTYLFYFADNLETEPENTFSLSIKVVYKKE